MIHNLKPYPAYKESGVPWLGVVPKHWEVRRVKRIARLNPSKSEAAPMLADRVSAVFLPMERVGTDGRIDASEARPISQVWNGFTYFRRSDVIVAKITPCFENGKGACVDGLPTEVGFGSTEFHVLRATRSVLPQFLYRTTTLPDFRRMGTDTMTGAAGQQRVPQSFVGNFEVALPPVHEQRTIVRFLDYADRRIRRYIRAKLRLIELLNEQKQAIINCAVTRGLDPNVRTKPSGVEWLGEIPEHWEMVRLRYLIRGKLTYGANEAAEHANREWPRYLRITDFRLDGSLRSDTFRSLPPEIAKEYSVMPGDILFARSGATVGKAFLVKPEAGEACHAGYLIRARPLHRLIHPEFLFAFTQSAAFARWKDSTFIIATIQNIGADKYADLVVPLPPTPEQASIIEYLYGATGTVIAAISRAEREIDLIREYWTRLIADVVTGKLDVRDVAARLPEEPEEKEEPEPLDEGKALDEETGAEDDLEPVGEAEDDH